MYSKFIIFAIEKVRIMRTSRIIEQILTFGLAGRLGYGDSSGYELVAAGDPSKVVLDNDPSLQLREEFKIGNNDYRLSDFIVFRVMGSSMNPQGIANGDFLLSKRVLDDSPINPNEYIIIEVDRDTYKKYEDSTCNFKLRKALLPIRPNDDVDGIIESLKDPKIHHNAIFLDKYQIKFKKKYSKTRELYPNDVLISSVTYRDGELFYSFHPRRLVQFKAVIKARIDKMDTDWSALAE